MRTGWYSVFLVLANVFWAGNFIVGALVVDRITPVELTFLRWALAAPILVVLALIMDRGALRTVLGEWWKHLLLALLGPIGYCLLTYEALRHTTPVNASLVSSINPVLIAVVATLIARERMSRAGAFGLGVSLLGVVLVISGGDVGALFGGGGDRTGDLLMIGAVLSWTAFTVFGRTLRTPPLAASAAQAVLASLVLLPFVAAGLPALDLDGGGWLAVLYIALFPSIGSFLLWAMSVKRLGAGTAGVYLNLLPIFTAVLGVLLGVPLSAAQIAGGVLVMVGVTLTSRAGRAGSRGAPVIPAGPVR